MMCRLWSVYLLLGSLLLLEIPAKAQTLSGTTWNIIVEAVSPKPYNLLFAATGHAGNILLPDGQLANFTWREDKNYSCVVQFRFWAGSVGKEAFFFCKIYGNRGTGLYFTPSPHKEGKPFTMLKL